MKFYDVECPIHGKMEIEVHPTNEDQSCPTICFLPLDSGKFCNCTLKRIYDAPAIHYKGSGFTGTKNK